jgi:hypothetical protein
MAKTSSELLHACHKRNLLRGSRGYPVGFTRHLFGNAPIVSKAMTNLRHGRGFLFRALYPTHAVFLCRRGTTPRQLIVQLGINCLAPATYAPSFTCVRFCGTSCDAIWPVTDPDGRSTSSLRHVYLSMSAKNGLKRGSVLVSKQHSQHTRCDSWIAWVR